MKPHPHRSYQPLAQRTAPGQGGTT